MGAVPVLPRTAAGLGATKGSLEAITDPAHEEHDSMLEWVGGSFDPEAFDQGDFYHRLHVERLVTL